MLVAILKSKDVVSPLVRWTEGGQNGHHGEIVQRVVVSVNEHDRGFVITRSPNMEVQFVPEMLIKLKNVL